MKELTITQKKKNAAGICITPFCMNKKKHGRKCFNCSKATTRKNNPERYCWSVLRNNAKRRGKEFTLTFKEFLHFLKKNPSYMIKKGTRVKSLQIDRIDNLIGYTAGNIRAITLRENVHKRHYEDKFPDKVFEEEMPEELPF